MKDPTHFLCIQITDQQVVDNVKKLQQKIYTNSPYHKHDLLEAMSDVHSLNLLLATIRIRNEKELKMVKETLSLYHTEVRKFIKESLYINFNGLGLLGDTELFMQIHNDRHAVVLKRIAEYLYQLLQDSGIDVRPRKTFIGQLTVFRYTPEQRNRGIVLHDYQWTDLKYGNFGRQKIESIQLCDMREKARYGYFRIDWEKSLRYHKEKKRFSAVPV